DVLITDDEAFTSWSGKAAILFSRRHIGLPVERGDNLWLHSVASPHELITLLGRIYRIDVDVPGSTPSLSSDASSGAQNDDMMILVVDDHPINRRLLADQLGSLGYHCKT